MPIEKPEPPEDVLEAARAGAARRPQRGGLRGRLTRGGLAPPSVEEPQRTYAMGLDALAEGRSLGDGAQPTGWRFLVAEDQQPVAAAEVHDTTRATVPAQLTEGPFVRSTADALGGANQLPGVRDASFEQRMLRIPALNLVALWLHTPERDDLVVPLAPAPPPLEAGRSYAEPEFTEIVTRLAGETLAAHREADRPDELGA